jgi:hypothetical protein
MRTTEGGGYDPQEGEPWMASVATGYQHVVIRNDGVPRIAGTTTKVVELVTERLA